MNSTIKIKKKICKTCETEQYIFSKGNCKRCAARSYAPIRRTPIAFKKTINPSDDNMQKWFDDRRKEMTGKCCLCGGRTEKFNDITYKRSIHHLFEKRKNMFPSVSTNKFNFLELCFYDNSCHSQIHNGKITWELLLDSQEREMILEKCKKIVPFIAKEEIKHLPDILKNIFDI